MSNPVPHDRGAASDRSKTAIRGSFLEKMEAARAQRQVLQETHDADLTAITRESQRIESAKVLEAAALGKPIQSVSMLEDSIETAQRHAVTYHTEQPKSRWFRRALSLAAIALALFLVSSVNSTQFESDGDQAWYERLIPNFIERLRADTGFLAALASDLVQPDASTDSQN